MFYYVYQLKDFTPDIANTPYKEMLLQKWA